MPGTHCSRMLRYSSNLPFNDDVNSVDQCTKIARWRCKYVPAMSHNAASDSVSYPVLRLQMSHNISLRPEQHSTMEAII